MGSIAPSFRSLRVFLSHASGDKPNVRDLSAFLRSIGIDVWLDEDKLLPGQDWKAEITTAVRKSDAIIVCLSKKAITKEGYVQREIKLALEIADEKPNGTIFVIPVRLDDSPVPDLLSKWQWVDLFVENSAGRAKLVQALVHRARGMDQVAMPLAVEVKRAIRAQPTSTSITFRRQSSKCWRLNSGCPLLASAQES
jgi:hypothetical protein